MPGSHREKLVKVGQFSTGLSSVPSSGIKKNIPSESVAYLRGINILVVNNTS